MSVVPGEPLIAFKDVYIGFDEDDVLRGISFVVFPGETKVLLGESGSGKPLVLKLSAGLIRPDAGSISVMGHDLGEMSELDLLDFRRHLGFVFQEGALFDSSTVGENVAFRLREEKVAEEEIESRACTKPCVSSSSNPRLKNIPRNSQAACAGVSRLRVPSSTGPSSFSMTRRLPALIRSRPKPLSTSFCAGAIPRESLPCSPRTACRMHLDWRASTSIRRAVEWCVSLQMVNALRTDTNPPPPTFSFCEAGKSILKARQTNCSIHPMTISRNFSLPRNSRRL